MNGDLPVEITKSVTELNEKQLRALNHIIVERLKLINRAHRLQQMANFSAGEPVSFEHNGDIIRGTVIRLNQKTISIITESNERWNVAPGLLQKEPELE